MRGSGVEILIQGGYEGVRERRPWWSGVWDGANRGGDLLNSLIPLCLQYGGWGVGGARWVGVGR